MIEISKTDGRFGDRALEARGGFRWWYLDVVGDGGDGVVVIWSYGLPFLPGYADAARRGEAPRARERPSLNVAVYRDWELDCYLLQEYDPEETKFDREQHAWRFGSSRLRVSQIAEGRRLVADLDCAVPGSDARLTGTIRAEGAEPRVPKSASKHGRGVAHRWMPETVPADASVRLAYDDEEAYEFRGRAYHDSNAGTVPLHDLGIDRWLWGRIPLEDRELVYYGLWADGQTEQPDERFGVVLERSGRMRRVDPIDLELGGGRFNLGGLRWWRNLSVEFPDEPMERAEITHRSPVDSGPFYMRYLTEVEVGDERATGVGELIRPDRVDLARYRPFVRMRVHDKRGKNSMWLPLFSGPRKGRFRRLLRHNIGGGSA